MANWDREIALQKVYGMGPVEALYWAEKEGGLSIGDSAQLHGVSYYTVRTMLQRAKMKVSGESEDKGWDSLLIVLSGTEGDIRDAVKVPAIVTIMTFASKITGAPIHKGNHLYAIPMGKGSGDIKWMNENVFRYVGVEGTVIQDVEQKAQKLYEMYERAGGTPDKMGLGVLMYWLDNWFMKYDVWTVDE